MDLKNFNIFENIFLHNFNKNNEGLQIIRGCIIFIIDILMNYNSNFFMFFFDIETDTKIYNLLIIFSFFILLSEILSYYKFYQKAINITKIFVYVIHLIILITISFILLKKNQMWGWSFYFFLMVFNFLIIIGVIKNIISNIFFNKSR